MRQKNNIRMRVQSIGETAAEFAQRLEGDCEEFQKELKSPMPPICVMTSAGDGRQTATIQCMTEEKPKAEEALIDAWDLQRAYEKYNEEFENKHPIISAMHYNDWLLKQKKKDY